MGAGDVQLDRAAWEGWGVADSGRHAGSLSRLATRNQRSLESYTQVTVSSLGIIHASSRSQPRDHGMCDQAAAVRALGGGGRWAARSSNLLSALRQERATF